MWFTIVGMTHVPADRDGWALVEEASRHGLIAPEAVAWAQESPGLDLVKVLEHLGGEAAKRGNDRLAEQLYRAALEEGSILPGVPFNLGNIATRAGHPREAIEWYSRAINLDPGLGSAYYSRGVQKRRQGDEPGARLDIAAGIERGYDGLEAYAALLRGRAGEFGDPIEALEQAVDARQAIAAGRTDVALMSIELESELRRGNSNRGLRAEVALVIALENECDVCQQMGDTDQAVTAGAELVRLCGRLADLDDDAWVSVPEVLREFVIGQLPRRLIAMIGLYTQSGRHQDALTMAEEAQRRYGTGPSRHRLLGDLSLSLAYAVYTELYRRALEAEHAQRASK